MGRFRRAWEPTVRLAPARPERLRFNRHNTAHRITSAQWTEANALSALMLASSLLREIDHWVVRSEQRTNG